MEAVYMEDCYQKEIESEVEESGEGWVVLGRTVFYPTGGGQKHDTGVIRTDDGEVKVTDVRKDHGRIKHFLEEDVELPEGITVQAEIDWERRYKNMRMHTAQHLVSAAVLDLFDASTAGNQIYPDRSRIDFEPADFSEEDLERIEEETNRLIEQDLEISIYELPREEAVERTEEERANLDLLPDSVEELRMIDIEDYDICPCGGTHVSSTGEIGGIEITGCENKGENTQRVTYILRG